MVFNIYKDGQRINSIVASEEFAAAYCEKYGYTFEAVPVVDPEHNVLADDDSNVWDELDAAYQEGVNSL